MLLSIIIPIYNTSSYLKKCIESVLSKNNSKYEKSYEIILVNDGSPDNSHEICLEYEKKYKQIRYFYKENGGLSEARNFGLEKARGEYIAFLDSDDFIKKDGYAELIEIALLNKSDIVIGTAVKSDAEGNLIYEGNKKWSSETLSGIDFLVKSIKENTMKMASTFNIYKKELIFDNKLFFKPGILHEDQLWTPQVFLKAKRVNSINNHFYYHVYREGSITTQKNQTRNGKDLIEICYELDKKYSKIDNKEQRKILKDYLSMLYLNAVFIGDLHKDSEVKLDYLFPLKRAHSLRNFSKSLLFSINKNAYVGINKIIKGEL